MKEQVKKMLVELSKEDLYEISVELNNLCKILNKANDTIFTRYIALRGYHTKTDFLLKNKIGHDTTLDRAIMGDGDSIYAHLRLKELLYIDDRIFYKYMENKVNDLESKGE